MKSFEDARLRQLAQRLVFDGAPDCLPPEDVARLSKSIADRLHADHGGEDLWRTLAAARREAVAAAREILARLAAHAGDPEGA